jgi:hypothetical protein
VTVALSILGGIIVILLTASKIPLAAAAFLRSCITLVIALEDLREALRRYGGARNHPRMLDDHATNSRTNQDRSERK